MKEDRWEFHAKNNKEGANNNKRNRFYFEISMEGKKEDKKPNQVDQKGRMTGYGKGCAGNSFTE